jgi:uncharacterized LabA/DUF88 family protein
MAGAQFSTYVFVDAQNFRLSMDECTRAWSGAATGATIDFGGIIHHWNATKLFYYDSVDEDASQQVRETHEAELDRIQRIDRAHVKTGWLTGRGRRRRQKGVDIQIAVDMMHHAARANMHRAILFSGDGDFAPLVDALVDMGITTEVVADRRNTAAELVRAADNFNPLDLTNYHRFADQQFQREFPLPWTDANLQIPTEWRPVSIGTVSTLEAKLYDRGRDGQVLTVRGGMSQNFRGPDAKKLQVFFDLQFGPAEWRMA